MAIYDGTPQADNIGLGTGATTGADSIRGLAGDDTIDGSGGSDTIDGGTGNDQLSGGYEGHDSIRAGDGDDFVQTSFEGGTVDGGAGFDNINCSSGDDSVFGGSGTDYIEGGGGNDTLSGGTGADTMIGNFGDDTYFVDNVGDYLIEYSSSDGYDVVNSSVSYTLRQYFEDLILTPGAATNGTGNSQANHLTGNASANSLSGLGGKDTVLAGGGDDSVFGGGGADDLRGEAGSDSLEGGDGGDRLTGGSGADSLFGGAGNDIFDYNSVSQSGVGPANRDVINDFTGVGATVGDRIDLADVFGGVLQFIGTTAFSAAGQVRVVAVGGNTLVQVNTAGAGGAEMEILVQDGAALPSQWVAGDFIL